MIILRTLASAQDVLFQAIHRQAGGAGCPTAAGISPASSTVGSESLGGAAEPLTPVAARRRHRPSTGPASRVLTVWIAASAQTRPADPTAGLRAQAPRSKRGS